MMFLSCLTFLTVKTLVFNVSCTDVQYVDMVLIPVVKRFRCESNSLAFSLVLTFITFHRNPRAPLHHVADSGSGQWSPVHLYGNE